jgi:Kdo2-lipid IVA lauroyltransferase/acyltransferase
MFPSRGLAARIRRSAKTAADAVLGWLTVGVLRLLRAINRKHMAIIASGVMRALGPMLKEQRIGRANLVAAFPEKSAAEIDDILRGVWDNLGRVTAELAHIDRLRILEPDRQAEGDIVYTPETYERFQRLRTDGKPALIFAAHLANWELPAVIAASDGLDSVVLYRRPNLGAIADAVMALRKGLMGELVASSMGAPVALARALEQGRHVAMLVDQHYTRGIDVTFFGRTCKVNPLIAMLAREVECPIHGTRVIRLPGDRFRGEISEEVKPARDAKGRIDVQGTMQAITDVVEEWVREHPEQWLWVHRRWR